MDIKKVLAGVLCIIGLMSTCGFVAKSTKHDSQYATVNLYVHHYRIAVESARPLPEIKNDFVAQALPIAKRIHAKYGIPTSAVLSMACLESNYGKSQLAREAHNYFGIKALERAGYRVAWFMTRDSGVRHEQPFRVYSSIDESFEDYARFLRSHERYANAFNLSSGPAFVRCVLHDGYCPDSWYMDNIRTIMLRHNLLTYDSID